MAEILVAAEPAVGPYLRGEVVLVRDDGWPWTVDDLAGYYLIRVPGPTAAQVQTRIDRLKRAAVPGQDPEAAAPDEPDRHVEVRPSNVRLDLSALPNRVRNLLDRDGVFETDVQTARQYVRRRRWDLTIGTDVDDGPFDG